MRSTLARARRRHAAKLQAVADVVGHGQVRKQRVVLEDDADVALGGRQARDVPPVEHDRALRQALEARDEPQQRRLPGAARAEQGQELARRDREVDAVQRDHGPELLADAAQLDGPRLGRGQRRLRRSAVEIRISTHETTASELEMAMTTGSTAIFSDA